MFFLTCGMGHWCPIISALSSDPQQLLNSPNQSVIFGQKCSLTLNLRIDMLKLPSFFVSSRWYFLCCRCWNEAVMGRSRSLLQSPPAAPHLPWTRIHCPTTWNSLPPSPFTRVDLLRETSWCRHGGAHHTLQWGRQHRSVLFHCLSLTVGSRQPDLYNLDPVNRASHLYLPLPG